jgi:polysaccharide chain length determinant protein (PEP-CTERM system associated)
MQPIPESYSTPRRALEVEDYIDIVRRHKAWILGPTFGALVVAVVVAFLWPDTYVSSAVIRVVPPTVPESYVPANINVEMSQRINAMAQTILSRGNLTNIINTFNLYQRERQRKPMEDVIEDMKKEIRIGQVGTLTNQRGVSAFTIAFSYDNRIVAQKVTADLVSRFMAENTRDRTNIAMMTTQFLKDQAENARKDLEAIEDKLAKFRMANQGRLPDQLQNNNILLNAAESRIGNINSAISRIQQDKMLRESELRSLNTRLSALAPATLEQSVAERAQNEKLLRNEQQIHQLELGIEALKQRYRPSHPDVQQAEANLAILKREHERLVKEDEEKKPVEAKPVIAKRIDPIYLKEKQTIEAAIARLQTEIHLNDKQADDYQRDLKYAEQQVREIRSRIESEPIGEKEYAEVIRDRENAKLRYDDFRKKMSQSETAEEIEKRQQGEQLEVLDPASLPATPTEPKRPVIIAIGTAFGLILGLGMAVAREAKDASLKNLKDVRAYTRLTILGSVPLLENDLVVRRRKRLTWLAWSTACSVGIIIMTGSVFYYFTTRV